MNILNRIIFTLLLLIGSGTLSYSQNYTFLDFGIESGLKDNFIYNIIQDEKAYLWLGTGAGVCRYDGIEFATEFMGDSLPNAPVKKSFKDSKNRIWFGYSNGNLAVLENSKFKLIIPEEDRLGTINGFTEDPEGRIIVTTQNKGLYRISDDYSIEYITKGVEGKLISKLFLLPQNNILLGTFDGLFLYEFITGGTELQLKGRFEDIPYTNIHTIISVSDNEYYIGTADEGLYFLEIDGGDIQSYTIRKIGNEFNLAYADVQDIFIDKKMNMWISAGGEGIYRLNYATLAGKYTSISHYTESSGLVSNYIQDIFQDIEGNLWFGSYGAGISVLKDQSFSFLRDLPEDYDNSIKSILEVGNQYWLGSETGILITDLSGKVIKVLGVKNGLPINGVSSMYQDLTGTIWIGTPGNGIFKIKPGNDFASPYYLSLNSLENSVNKIIGKDNRIWVATNGGVILFNTNTGQKRIFTTEDRLPHNKIQDIFMDSKDEIWIATRSNGIFNLTKTEGIAIDVQAEIDFVSITEDKQGIIWAVTQGDGVFGFTEDSLVYFSAGQGLRSDYCYSIMEDSDENLWIGHRLGLSRISKDRNNIKTYSVEQGIDVDFNANAVIRNAQDQLVFGASKGLVIYDAKSDIKDTIPPKLTITSLRISDKEYDYSQPVFLPFNRYKIRIDYRGINLKNPDFVYYQYKLDGYDDWSEPTSQSYVNYSRIEDGKYIFMLKACDENGVCTTEPLEFIIEVKEPIWKTWWFIVSLFLSLFILVYSIIKIRERKQKQLQEYLQTSLDERTKEVRAQATELENKNRDITDSINYAQRIQASILPPIGRLQSTFSGSFVFYQPRDIVSGDFYWYDTVFNNKFVIVCADSTGHGVPGAFMSMIGTTLIKEICSRSDVNSPSQILEILDQEIQAALNQNVEAEKSNDGMDIIVAEIDLKTNYLKVASAMRPIILYIDGEQIYVKGSRNSVGGKFDEDSEDKVFIDEGFQLSKGDQVYMFSDGYPDQFGGPLGKKFKMVRLKNLLRDIHDKTMDEQYNYIKSNFMLWKEELEQVDDVLFMGIRI
ncbi:MAG: SpoIIE family protein phosphatase [Bacteroidales bacterium]|nr:SpoIIE family protein phosphatase [Bacteroidales bacterium]MCF8389960.1 SpoIIE family protein phosphatase [Bacteroidales bacterium]